MMKGRFFRKSHRQVPHSVSYDSQLSDHQQQKQQPFAANNSIDKPGLRPIGESLSTSMSSSSESHRHLPLLQSSLCQLSPISSQTSSTQGMIGCANELFDTPTGRQWDFPAEMKLLSDRKQQQQPMGRQFEGSEVSCSTVVKCPDKSVPLGHQSHRSGANGNQVADLVFTLAQQLSGKDAEIVRLKAHLRKSECRMERVCRDFERDLERKCEELDEAREQQSRMRKKLRSAEMEMEIASRVQQRMASSREEPGAEAHRERLMVENAQLKDRLAKEMQQQTNRELEWQRERKELKQSVQSLNGTLEELEGELRHRESREREMQLELDKAVVERQLGLFGREDGIERLPVLDLPSPKADSGTACLSSNTSSSGIGSLKELLKELPDREALDKALAKARWRLAECRTKIGQMVETAEKARRGERLGREDLFGSSLSSGDNSLCTEKPSSTSLAVEEHVKQIAAVQKHLELLHDKFTILYAKGVIGR